MTGAGTASFAAYRAIKSKDPTAKILIVGDENRLLCMDVFCLYRSTLNCLYRLPYMRPPLSKELWFNEDKAAVEELRDVNQVWENIELIVWVCGVCVLLIKCYQNKSRR